MANMFNGASAFNQDLSSWIPLTTSNFSNFLFSTNLSTFHYNELLDKRSQLTGLKTGINPFTATPAQYGGCSDTVPNAQVGIEGHNILASEK
jgi:hypothetical protein